MVILFLLFYLLTVHIFIPPSAPQAVYMNHAETISSFFEKRRFNFGRGEFNLHAIQWKYLPDDGYFIQM